MIKKTVIFIRHGESKWNEIFNDGKAITRFFKPTFFIRLFSGMFWETMDAVSGDSVFLDSPLSMEGVEQAVGLADFLERKEKCEDEKVMATVRSRLSERARLEIVILTESYQKEIEPHEKPAKRSWRKRASTQTEEREKSESLKRARKQRARREREERAESKGKRRALGRYSCNTESREISKG
eukprot:1390068-Amorphochlora_amoeboformis.AAC.1